MTLPMLPHFISFADARYRAALNRIVTQAKQSGFFATARAYNEEDLDPTFKNRYAELLVPSVRGFGYWIWKPQIILQSLQSLPAGATLVYADAGCHVNYRGRNRFDEYLKSLNVSVSGVLAFELDGVANRHLARQYTKEDTFEALLRGLSPEDGQRIRDLPQISATVILLRNDANVRSFIRRWSHACSDVRVLDDTPSLRKNACDFVDHRHDQSIFSILSRINSVELISQDEQYPAKRLPNGMPDWNSMEQFPLLARRDRGGAGKNRFLARTEQYFRKRHGYV